MELNELHKKWLKSLREHPERQCSRKLGQIINKDTKEYEACCLGELLLLHKGEDIFNNMGVISDGNSTCYPNASYRELGLYSPTGIPRNTLEDIPSLSELNDSGKTWPEIADIIESNPERYLNYET